MSARIRTLVVGVAKMQDWDPKLAPPGEDPVLAPAVELAQRTGATLHVVHAVERSRPGPATSGAQLTAVEHCRSEALLRLRDQVGRFAGVDVHCHCVEGQADIQLCGFAEEIGADLLIVGATRRGRVWLNALGSVSDRVLRRSTLPVLVVRRPFEGPVRRVLLTTDLSELSPALHEAGCDLLERLFPRQPLALRTLLVCGYDTVTAARVSQALIQTAAATRLHEFLRDRHAPSTPTVEARVRIGNPSTEIVREAVEWQADLLVLGGQARGVSPGRLGTTASAALRAVSCNALVVPAAFAAARRVASRGDHAERASGFPGTEEHRQTGLALVGG